MKRFLIMIVFLSQIIGIAVAQDTVLFAKNNASFGSRFMRIDTVSKIIFDSSYSDEYKSYDNYLDNAIKTGKDSIAEQNSHIVRYGGIQEKKVSNVVLIFAKKLDNAYFLSMDEYTFMPGNWEYNIDAIIYYILLIIVFVLFSFFIRNPTRGKRILINLMLLSAIIFTIRESSNYQAFVVVAVILSGVVSWYMFGTFLVRLISNYLYQIDREDSMVCYSLMIYYSIVLFSLRIALFIFSGYTYCIIPSIIMLLIIVISIVFSHRKMKEYRNSDEAKNRKGHVMTWKEYRKVWNRDHLNID